MNRKVVKLLKLLSKITLSVIPIGVILILLSSQIKIEVTTTRELDRRDWLLLETTTKTSSPDATTTIKFTTSTEVTTEVPTTIDPRISFDKVINPHPFKYKLTPSGVCRTTEQHDNQSILILVKSNVFQIGHRMAIRSTWGNLTRDSYNIQLAFLLGDSTLVESFTDMEYKMYKDLIQEDFIDEYKNNTLKTIMGFNWAVAHCPHVNYVLFVDDDYFVNIPNLVELVSNISNSDNTTVFMGYQYVRAAVRRRKDSKWYISEKEYPSKHWPPYISGGSMLISMDVVKRMTEAFPHVRPLFIDDVYLGIVANALNITLTHDKRFEVNYVPEKFDSLIATHDFGSPNVLIQEWFEPEEDTVSEH